MTSASAGHIILTPTQPVGSAGGHSGNRTRDLLTRSRALYRLSYRAPQRERGGENKRGVERKREKGGVTERMDEKSRCGGTSNALYAVGSEPGQ